jgi:hypothetical protein
MNSNDDDFDEGCGILQIQMDIYSRIGLHPNVTQKMINGTLDQNHHATPYQVPRSFAHASQDTRAFALSVFLCSGNEQMIKLISKSH